MGAAARQLVLAHYARPVVMARVSALIDDVLKEPIMTQTADRRRRRDAGPQAVAGVARDQLETWATVRAVTPALEALGVVDDRTITGVDVDRFETLEAALDRARPDVVVNCVGIIKQLAAAKDPVASIAINALHPHLLARAGRARGARVIHISTDCVFDGDRAGRTGSGYTEADVTERHRPVRPDQGPRRGRPGPGR